MKHQISNLIRTFLFSFLFILLFSIVSLAEEGLIYFTDPEVKAGESVEVSMTVQSDNTSIGDVDVLLNYPSDSLEFKKGTNASGGAGRIRIHGKGTKDGEHKMVYALSFSTSKPGEFTVNIDTCEVYDENGAAITISHVGSSKITVTGTETPSGSAVLSSLEVSPGTLIPDFSPEITSYSVTVGLSVDHLTINALPGDSNSTVSVVNNENLKDGENDVIIYVQSSDGQLQNEYHITVLKTEGGEENLAASQEAPTVESVDGVQLSCKGKTITIMETGEEVSAPEGYRESQVKIDGKPVKGWICGDDSHPEYFLVYGMNDAGELNFYRYDISERTIQRYFSETTENDPRNSEEYITLKQSYDENEAKLSSGKLILVILAIIALLMLGILIYLGVRLSSVSKELDLVQNERISGNRQKRLDPEKSRRTRNVREKESYRDSYDDDSEDEEDEEYYYYDDDDNNGDEDEPDTDRENDATRVIPAAGRRRTSRRAVSTPEETTVIRRTSRRRRNSGSEFEDI